MQALEAYLALAYAPYSRFPVAAAVIDEQGRAHFGVNVENAAYPLGACAETMAIGAMIVAGGRRIVAVYLAAGAADEITPCGGCRQRLAEFAGEDCLVAVVKGQMVRARTSLGVLLPAAFRID